MPVVASLLFTKGQDGTGILKVAKEQIVKEMKCKKVSKKFGVYTEKDVSLHRFLRKASKGIGLWCNGSTTGFGSVCPSSNLGSPTSIHLSEGGE